MSVARSVSVPVGRLVHATQRLAHGDLTQTVPETGVRDLRHLAVAFNSMTRELADARERLELMWRREEVVRIRSEFLGHVSHELRTPITAILNYTDILRDPSMAASESERRTFLDVIHEQSKRLMRLISDLLDVSRIESGSFRCVAQDMPVEPAVRRSIEALRRSAIERGVDLNEDFEAELPAIYADPDRVEQVLGNLIGNAIKFTPKGGRIEVAAYRAGRRRGRHTGDAGGPEAVTLRKGLESAEVEREGYVELSVRDDGVGIPADQHGRIFEQFVQLSPPTSGRRGAGLGLTIAANIVTQLGGAIWVESEAGNGSTFHFTLPVAGAPVRRPLPAAAATEGAARA